MVKKSYRRYIQNKLNNSIKIKTHLKSILLKSFKYNSAIINKYKAQIILKYGIQQKTNTTINDVCLNSSIYKKANKQTNFSRYEFHKLCRTNKLSNLITYSW